MPSFLLLDNVITLSGYLLILHAFPRICSIFLEFSWSTHDIADTEKDILLLDATSQC